MPKKATKRRRGGLRQQVRRGNRVYLYLRVSDIRGREDSLISDDVQEDQGRRYCAREGLEVVGVIKDMGKSGRESEKREIANIINNVEDGKADGVVVWKISRWGRNTIDSMLNIGELQSVGGFVASATENLDDIETPHGKFSLTVLLAIAQLYSDEIGKTWANIHDYRRSLGKTAHGTPRMGYKRENDEYVPDPETAPWIRKAFEQYIAGKSLNTLVGEMRDAGVTSTRGNALSYNTLLSNMDNGFAAGFIVDRRDDEVVYHKGAHEPLIDMETWEAFLLRRKEKVPARTKSAPYRLARLLKCDGCGGNMHATWQVARPNMPRRRVFKCNRRPGSFQRQEDCHAPAQIDERYAEEAVLQWLRGNVKGQEALDAAIARQNKVEVATVDKGKIEAKIKSQKRRLSILADKVIDGDISRETAREKEAEIKAEISRLEERMEEFARTIRVNSVVSEDVITAIIKGWNVLDAPQINEALQMAIREVRVRKHPLPHRRASVSVLSEWEAESAASAVSEAS